MKISLWAGSDIATIDEALKRTRAAVDDGFESIWFAQTAAIDTITALAVVARAVPDIKLGTAVVPIQGRHPIPLALQALTLADAAGPGRVTLGVGVTHKPVSEGWFGIPYSSVVGLCAEELEALNALLDEKRTANVEGSHLAARITLGNQAPMPSLVVAALGTKMLDLAGRYTDGTVTWMTGLSMIERQIVPGITDAAASAGRRPPRVIVGLPVCVTDDVAAARQVVGAAMAGAAQMPSYKRMIAAEGVDEPVDIALIGNEDAVAEGLAALAAVGATEVMANVLGPPETRARTRSFLAAVQVSGKDS